MVPLKEMIFISMESLTLPCIFVLSIVVLYISVKRRNFSQGPENLVPSPPKLPFIGNIHQLGSLHHQSLYTLSLKYGPLMLLHFGEVPWLIVSSSDMARAIMRTHDPTFASRPRSVAADILCFRDMAFEPYGEDWRQLKKVFTIHLISTKKTTSYKTIIEEEASELVAKISNHASSSGGPIGLSKLLFSYMTDEVCRVVSGKFIMEEQRHAMVKEVIEETFQLLGQFFFSSMVRRANRIE